MGPPVGGRLGCALCLDRGVERHAAHQKLCARCRPALHRQAYHRQRQQRDAARRPTPLHYWLFAHYKVRELTGNPPGNAARSDRRPRIGAGKGGGMPTALAASGYSAPRSSALVALLLMLAPAMAHPPGMPPTSGTAWAWQCAAHFQSVLARREKGARRHRARPMHMRPCLARCCQLTV